MAGIKEKMVEIDISDGATLRDLFNKLAEKYGNGFREVVIDSKTGNLQRRIMVIVNDRLASNMNGLETKLSGGDTVAISVAYAGGWG
jgi:molybdopterin converting factor small subunit